MSYSPHQIQALIVLNPEEASKRILQAFREAGMRKADVATILGCSHGTLIRWVDQLQLDSTIDEMREKAKNEGWIYERKPGSGRPKGSEDSHQRIRRWEGGSKIQDLIVKNPKKAAKKILHILRKARMQREAAAKMMGCSVGTMGRVIEELGLSLEVSKLRRKAKTEGWIYKRKPGPGRPKGSEIRVNPG